MLKSKDNITIYIRHLKSGDYIFLRGSVMINNKLVNKRVATGHLATSENLAKLMACAKPTFISKIDELIREGLSFGKFLTNAKEQINISSNDETVQVLTHKRHTFGT